MPRPTGEELNSLYHTYYSRETLEVPASVMESIASLVKSFHGFQGPRRALLDFGYGEGFVLREAERQGWQVSGVELSVDSLASGADMGWSVAHADNWMASLPGPFDVVTLIETIEHVPNPLQLLNEISEVLPRGGLLYGTTPNGSGLNEKMLGTRWSVMTAPEHLQLFSAESLSGLLHAAGFGRVSLTSSGFNPAEVVARMTRRRVTGDSRVQSGYELADKLDRGVVRRSIKRGVQKTLAVTGLGDTIKFWAIRT